MKICCPVFAVFPSRSAHAVNILEMCDAFATHGHSVVCLTPFLAGTQAEILRLYGVEGNFLIHQLPWKIPFRGKYFFSLPFVSYMKRSLCPDIVYTRFLSIAFWSVVQKMPVFLEMHRPVESIVERERLKFFLNSKYCLGLIVISKYLEGFYRRYTEKVFLLPDGVAVHRFSVCAPEQIQFGGGYAGHLYEGRGLPLVEKLALAFPELPFHVWGGDDKTVFSWKQKTQHIFNLQFHGFIPHAQIFTNLPRCQFLLLPYQKSVFLQDRRTNTAQWMSPLKLFEYMASGRPIIASDLPAIREILTDKKNALLVDPEHAEDWKRAVRLLLSNPQLTESMAQQARKEAEEKYSWEKRAESILGIIKK